MHRQPNDSPVHYPVACTPQSWAAASFFMMIHGLLGLRPEASKRSLRIDNPRLPHHFSDLTIRNLRIGNTRLTLQATRHNDRTFVNVVEQSGENVRVTIDWD
jgi:glycogen debranching enzyme